MTVQKGFEVIVGIEDGTFAGSYNLLEGQQTGEIQYTDGEAIYTHKQSTGLWQERMDGGTVRNVRLSVSSVLTGETQQDAVVAALLGAGARHQALGFVMPGLGMLVGDFQLTESGVAGELDQPASFTITAQSVGDVSLIPAVTAPVTAQASLVLDFVAGSYWVAGVHTAALASVSGITITRASKAWDPLWDFTNGGTVGTLTEYASGAARVGAHGLLVEEASTNALRNARLEGASAGTPGTMSTDTYIGASGGLTWSVVGSGTENGWPYVELSATGTWSADGRIDLAPLVTGSGSYGEIAALDGETWTFSVGLKLVSGAIGGEVKLAVWERTAAGSTTVGNLGSDISGSIDASHRRFIKTDTLSGGGTTALIVPSIYFDNTSGAVTFAIRIYAPQVEEKAYPTSPVLPVAASPAASTRAADEIGVADGPWASASAGTWYADVQFIQPQGLNATRYFVGGDGSSRWLYYSGQGASFYDGSTVVAAPNTETQAAGDTLKVASAYDASGVSIVADYSASVGTGGAPNLANLDPSSAGGMGLGGLYGSAAAWSGYYRAVRYWPARRADDELAAFVGN